MQKQLAVKVRGFTLIELSISLVIIALLISGVMVGRSLIRQSEVNSVMIDTRNYIVAFKEFQDKYKSLPGDMSNATKYWGIAGGSTGSDSDCYSVGSQTSPATCNGDGNGHIDWFERLREWQHLGDSGIIKGAYSGIGPTADLTTNSPAGRPDNVGYVVFFVGIESGDSNLYDGVYNHLIYIGGVAANDNPHAPTLTGPETQGLDTKYDDGKPATGSLRGWKHSSTYAPSCTNTDDVSAVYTTSTQKVCSFVQITGF